MVIRGLRQSAQSVIVMQSARWEDVPQHCQVLLSAKYCPVTLIMQKRRIEKFLYSQIVYRMRLIRLVSMKQGPSVSYSVSLCSSISIVLINLSILKNCRKASRNFGRENYQKGTTTTASCLQTWLLI